MKFYLFRKIFRIRNCQRTAIRETNELLAPVGNTVVSIKGSVLFTTR
jgi:hypothetical protein